MLARSFVAPAAIWDEILVRPRPNRGRLIVLMDEYDPRTLARLHYRENVWLRSILESVARELERMASRGQGETEVLLGRARRVRQRLHQGVPDGWSAGR